jgi:transcriptional regulator with XRE-family HTH domain
MHSRKKTTVAVLRLELGLTVEEFAALIGKSISAVTSLETGRLALSEDTAQTIAAETGVALDWLLHGNAKEKPYVFQDRFGMRDGYTRRHFERIQAAKSGKAPRVELPHEMNFVKAIDTVCPWISVYYKAAEKGEIDLAVYLMRKAIDELAKRFGKDDKAVLQATEKVRIRIVDEEYMITGLSGNLNVFPTPETRSKISRQFHQSMHCTPPSEEETTSKSAPFQPSPGNARRGANRKSASPRRRRGGP